MWRNANYSKSTNEFCRGRTSIAAAIAGTTNVHQGLSMPHNIVGEILRSCIQELIMRNRAYERRESKVVLPFHPFTISTNLRKFTRGPFFTANLPSLFLFALRYERAGMNGH